jgi:GxxExxY protein
MSAETRPSREHGEPGGNGEKRNGRNVPHLGGEEKERLDDVTERVIGCAIDVHRALGPGLPELAYERALCVELERRGVRFARQVAFPIEYRGQLVGELRLDLLIEDAVVVEVKAVERLDPVHAAQVKSYLRVAGKRLGLLINFNVRVLVSGVRRVAL